MKRIVGMQLAVCCLAWSFGHAVIMQQSGVVKSGSEYKKAGDLGFEMYNQSGKQIWYALKNGRDFSELFTSRPIAGTPVPKQHTLDIDNETTLALWFSPPKDFEPKGMFSFNKNFAFSPDPDKVYTFTKGKTIYVTLDSSGLLRPEASTPKSLWRKTTSGLSLKKNIEAKDITTLR